jgi:hypothetical protein
MGTRSRDPDRHAKLPVCFANSTVSMPAVRGVQCWECRRRRLVCDSIRPRCRKCQVRGVDCPGYDGKKPLKWLQPQQVNSKGPAKIIVHRALKSASEREMTVIFEAIEYCKIAACRHGRSANTYANPAVG